MEKSFMLGMIALVKSAFTGETAILPNDFDFTLAYKVSRAHSVAPVIYYGITGSGIQLDPELNNRFFTAVCQNITVCEKQKSELNALQEAFENNAIDYMPLKGTVIRDLYPKIEMRTMGDADILIKPDQYDRAAEILQQRNYTFVKESLNEFVWRNPSLLLELHQFLLSPKHSDYFKILGDGWKFANPVDGHKHKYQMTNEDFFVFIFAHMAKHYRSSGVGIKHIIDLWLYRNLNKLDDAYIKEKLNELKLLKFYENVLKTIDVWFNNGNFDEVTLTITKKIFGSGAFGTRESANKSQAIKTKKRGAVKHLRLHRILNTMFLPYKSMCGLFPILDKAPVLLPFMWLYRGFYCVFCKKGNLAKTVTSIQQLSERKLTDYETELNLVGLDYNFEE